MWYHQIACLSIYCSSMDCQFSFKFKQLVWSYFCFFVAQEWTFGWFSFARAFSSVTFSHAITCDSVINHSRHGLRLSSSHSGSLSPLITTWLPFSSHHILALVPPSPLITYWLPVWPVSYHHSLATRLISSHFGSLSHLIIFCISVPSNHILTGKPVSYHHILTPCPITPLHSGSSRLFSSHSDCPSHLIKFWSISSH